ncbi:SDR family oxidoreductase [Thiospirochaeta perfilievii]|uniref:SDR family oxidoreductase n=1 Tax=Thiospirochaeta perfilievii TaxID=252967 RepID=A0A5C1QEW5_9SPIO|nr:NAD-dependent epimerase/dehydratase family protein [Thiospirochaeta perfilievii]QEN05620.1 SDR family oxidoreductase [Thiospirochaeta perfilievii]
MNILVTGAKGFIGKNLISELRNKGYSSIFEYDIDTSFTELEDFTNKCDFVFHLAGVNRPENQDEFMKGNYGFTTDLLELLEKQRRQIPVLITSSIQATSDNPYGKSKKAGEDVIFEYGEKTGSNVYVYRLPNVFGKWSRPNYNTVVATFCYKIVRNQDIQINDPKVELSLVYIDDVVTEFIKTLSGITVKEDQYSIIPVVYKITLGRLAELIKSFKDSRNNLSVINTLDELENKLYATYLSFLPQDDFGYNLKMNVDSRGSFTEFLRTGDRGQVSVNVAKPGITKGNHWHHTKNEKFLVVSGKASIKFRALDSKEIIEYLVTGDNLRVIDIPTGYTHNIENIGDTDLVTVMWANECFNPEKPDTYFLEV